MTGRRAPKVLHYTHASRSGAARYVASLVGSLAEEAEGVSLLCPRDFEYAERLRPLESVTLRDVLPGIPHRGSRPSKALRMAAQVFAGLRAIAATPPPQPVVHFNFVEPAPPSLALFALCRTLGMATVMTVHDVWPHRFLFPRSLQPAEVALLRARYRLADRLVVHTESGAATLTRDFGVAERKVSIIPHGAFALAAEPLAYHPTRETHVLLFGALREYKGVHLAIAATQALRAEGVPIRLTIAGPTHASERTYWSACKTRIAASPSGIDVRDDYVPSDELVALFEAAHVVVLPYTQFDSQSGVAAQALASGRAVVATAVGGLGEIMRPGENGFLIESPTVQATTVALRRAVESGHTRLAQMGRDAAARFLAEFSWSAVAARHAALYRSMAGVDMIETHPPRGGNGSPTERTTP